MKPRRSSAIAASSTSPASAHRKISRPLCGSSLRRGGGSFMAHRSISTAGRACRCACRITIRDEVSVSQTPHPARHVPVLIVGGGPVGLALAADLGWRGIGCQLVEQGDGTISTPKMNEVNARTMEFCRRWGIADAVRNCPFPGDYSLDVVFVTSLTGHELARMRRPTRAQQKAESYSPERLQICSQLWFDPILRAFAQAQPSVTLRYRTRLEAFEPSAEAVCVELHDLESGKRETVRADYLVGC